MPSADARTGGASRDVRFHSGDIALAGTYVDVVGPPAGALILSGSGKLDRDSNSSRFRGGVSKALADALENRGVASLRYDKRGAGQSQGALLNCSMSDNYADARAALGWLAGAPRRSARRHRPQRGRAACRPSGYRGGGRRRGGPHSVRRPQGPRRSSSGRRSRSSPSSRGSSKAILKVLRIDPLRSQRKAFERIRSSSADVVPIQGKRMNARWIREFLDYDPVPVFGRLSSLSSPPSANRTCRCHRRILRVSRS